MNREHHRPPMRDFFLTRRDFLNRCGMGMGALGLASVLDSAGLLNPAAHGVGGNSPLAPKLPPLPGKARRVLHLFMQGGPSHVDTFDPKPMLEKHAGQSLKDVDKAVTHPGAAFPTPFKFNKYGQSGLEISEVFSKVGEHADKLAVIRSMSTATPSHEHSMMLINSGEQRLVRPSLGSWVTYGLGTENQNLPAFIAMSPSRPLQGDQNWQSAFLPGIYQGTYVDTRTTQVDKLIEFIKSSSTSLAEQRRQLDLLRQLNDEHSRKRAQDQPLETRIQSFETAYRMQLEATDAFDINKEPEAVRARYGDSQQARQILIARRLLERGVRFVQVWQNAWDHHAQVETGVRSAAKEIDQPIAALLTDLKERGMLDDTLIIWAGEFGRTPTVDANQNVDQTKGKGRDHNNRGFSIWMAGGGVKGGLAYGATDQWGFAAAENKVDVPDFHATILHLLGFDHEKLIYRYAGRDFRLTNLSGTVIKDILA
ncbi:MAG: DUF1501 domain-containing protein [Verrucomicrobia bacterium]|nr:DUF1501 domain-containing protein [Verrucomicrobiota bacterium]